MRVPEVKQHTKLKSRSMQIIKHLRPVNIRDFRHSLQFHDYLAIANEVSLVSLFQVLSLITYDKQLLAFERNTP